MLVLVLNAGSSSLKGAVTDISAEAHLVEAKVERIGQGGPATHEAALAELLPQLMAAVPAGATLSAVGHRIVHGAERFIHPTLLDDEASEALSALIPLAPLHLPANLACLAAARHALPALPHVGIFDTAFHATLPRRARALPLPTALVEAQSLRRYGFHGTSHAQIAARTAAAMGTELRQLRLVTLHLGNGASGAAVEYGQSVETTMGMTPLSGLVMGTRSGDIDPGVLLHLLRHGYDVDALDALLNRESGLAGLSGRGADLRDIEARAAEGDERCRLAIQVFAHSARKAVGALAAVMGGVDAIAFSAGIGENSALMRHRIAQRLDFLGAQLDEDLNRDATPSAARPVIEISTRNARCRIFVVRSDEQLAIAEQTARLVSEQSLVKHPGPIPVAVSARHVHLTEADVAALFGPGHQLTPRRDLGQPGQFICEERVTIVGPKRSLENVGIIGPTRRSTQVEISRTDEFFLGIDAPVRESGNVKNTPGITLVGPAGSVKTEQGVICAWRHIHMRPEEALAYGVKDRDMVEVEIDSQDRDLVFRDVMVRVSEASKLEMHIDTDEANAAELSTGAMGVLHATEASATLVRRRPDRDPLP